MGFFSKTNQKIGSGSDIEGADSRKGFYWVEDQKGENVMWRLPRNIMWNDNVLVREDEYGIFFRDGKALVVFDRPDRYALTTENIPVLKSILGTVVGNVQIGEFYWAQKREFRDVDFGVVQLRIFGQFSYKIVDPLLLITQFVGTKGLTKSEEIVEWMKSQVIMVLNDTLGELKAKKQMGVLDMPGYRQEIEQLCLGKLTAETEIYGLKIMKFAGLNINMPEEVQEAINKRGAMSALGVNYIQYQSGKAIEGIGQGAAQGGEGSGFAMMGAGMSMGGMMTQSMAGGGGQPAPFGGQQAAAPRLLHLRQQHRNRPNRRIHAATAEPSFRQARNSARSADRNSDIFSGISFSFFYQTRRPGKRVIIVFRKELRLPSQKEHPLLFYRGSFRPEPALHQISR